jgi:hypothetical protein
MVGAWNVMYFLEMYKFIFQSQQVKEKQWFHVCPLAVTRKLILLFVKHPKDLYHFFAWIRIQA